MKNSIKYQENITIKKNIAENLPESLKAIPVFAYDEVDSTNSVAQSIEIENRYALVTANRQTSGRGRLGRSFFSPEGGIYMSLIIDLKNVNFTPELPGFFTTAAAVAVAKSIEDLAKLKPQIKWVNDVYLNGKKVCGILAEGKAGMTRSGLEKMIIGIGLNYGQTKLGQTKLGRTQFPKDLAEIATSLFRETQGFLPYKKEKLMAKIMEYLIDSVDKLLDKVENDHCTDISPAEFEKKSIVNYARKHSYLLGEKIIVHKAGQTEPAVAVDIDEESAGLIVKYDSGKTEIITSGEVTVRKTS